MKLLIFPGGGNPDDKLYSKVYGLLVERAPQFGYTAVDTSVRWPGHVVEGGTRHESLSFQGALTVAEARLNEYERLETPFDILGRSFGTYVALKATTKGKLSNLRRVILWGAPPFWLIWQMFVRDLDKNRKASLKKGLNIDQTFFPTLEPIESLIQETHRSVVVATGSDDRYSTPFFHAYLMQVASAFHRDLSFRPPVKGAPHEVTADLAPEIVEDYLNCVLG